MLTLDKSIAMGGYCSDTVSWKYSKSLTATSTGMNLLCLTMYAFNDSSNCRRSSLVVKHAFNAKPQSTSSDHRSHLLSQRLNNDHDESPITARSAPRHHQTSSCPVSAEAQRRPPPTPPPPPPTTSPVTAAAAAMAPSNSKNSAPCTTTSPRSSSLALPTAESHAYYTASSNPNGASSPPKPSV